MTRWKVEYVDCGDYRRWFAFEQQPWGWDDREAFPIFEEALAYADKMARTVTVTLPRETPRDVELTLSKRDRWDKYVTIKVMKPGETTTLEELALTLLAHARKEKQ